MFILPKSRRLNWTVLGEKRKCCCLTRANQDGIIDWFFIEMKGKSYVIAYELYAFDATDGYELIGILPERRRASGRITEESVINWGRQFLSGHSKDRVILFKKIVLPNVSHRRIGESSGPFTDKDAVTAEISDPNSLSVTANRD